MTKSAYPLLWEEMTAQERAQERRRLKKPDRRHGASGPSGPTAKFDVADFVAIDGEGWGHGPILPLKMPALRKGGKQVTYESQDHHYTMLAASNGKDYWHEIRSPADKRLTTKACLDFLCDVAAATAPSILVIFAGGYDVNHMLMFGLSKDDLTTLAAGKRLIFTIDGDSYCVEYRARKSLAIGRTRLGGKREATVTLWDVFGFFQESFVKVVGKWLGSNHPYLSTIADMKAKRSSFGPSQVEEISAYNKLELSCLVQIMNKLRESIGRLGLKISRWDGAGSVAAAMYKANDVKQSKAECPPAVYAAACHAYSGGHIEVFQIGHHERVVHHYDVNSAYPSGIAELPVLAGGTWRHTTLEADGMEVLREDAPFFTLVYVEYEWEIRNSFHPLFYRVAHDSTILYPSHGAGWYWLPEIRAAQQYHAQFGGTLRVIETYQFTPLHHHKPFAFIPRYYNERQEYAALIKRGNLSEEDQWMSGAEKIIKLGLNSLYGKMVQQIGARNGEPPPFFQIEWGGYVTSHTRAKLMTAAIQNMPAIISIATDGIFSTEPLTLPCPDRKTLGAWEYQQHTGITIAMAGVYWLWDETEVTGYSRGFHKDAMESTRDLMEAWKRGDEELPVQMQRLIGMGTACSSAALYSVRGRFLSGERMLNLRGQSAKRMRIPSKGKPHLRLVPSEPNWNSEHTDGLQACSAIYPIDWDGNSVDTDVLYSLTEYREMQDMEEA